MMFRATFPHFSTFSRRPCRLAAPRAPRQATRPATERSAFGALCTSGARKQRLQQSCLLRMHRL
jgi:hypothetical protein